MKNCTPACVIIVPPVGDPYLEHNHGEDEDTEIEDFNLTRERLEGSATWYGYRIVRVNQPGR